MRFIYSLLLLLLILQPSVSNGTQIKNHAGVKKWISKNSNVSEKTIDTIIREVNKTDRPLLYLSIINVESSFNPRSRSHKDALGLGQIHSVHIKELKKKGIIKNRNDLYKVRNNVKAIEYIFNKKLSRSNGNINRSLDRYLGKKSPKYRSKVQKSYSQLKSINSKRGG